MLGGLEDAPDMPATDDSQRGTGKRAWTRRLGPKRVRIGDVARSAGVSPATVSAFLSGNRPVSPETRSRIQTAIAETGYRANAAAKALAHGRTNTLGLLIPPVGRSLSLFDEEFIASVVQSARAADYDVLVSTSLEERQVFARLVEEQRVDGIILLEIYLEDRRVERLLREEFPFVAVGRTSDPSAMSWVDIDFGALARSFVKHLADLRHQDIVLFNNSKEQYTSGYGPARRAEEGFSKACDEFGAHGRVVYCGADPEAGLRETERLLAEHGEFTGVAVTNDYAIWGIYQALALAGRRIPQDVSVIALADSRWAEALSPRLTAAQHPVAEMGAEAVRLLLAELAGGSEPEGRLLLPPVILRESTAAAPPAGAPPTAVR
jgi:DNA-binding LacI/PurR family transcriptional regulator